MQIFINEASLCGQYTCLHHFQEAVKLFVLSLRRIHCIQNDKDVLTSKHFYCSNALSNVLFESALKSDTTLRNGFYENFQRVNPKCWESSKCHEGHCIYDFSGKDYVGTSIAELAERKLRARDLDGFLMNFEDSPFGDSTTIEILKDGKDPISVDCATSPESIEEWLIVHGFLKPDEEYDESSKFPPSDHQTVLRDSNIFVRTNYLNKGRRVYRRSGTNELWCVDHSHAGKKAHIEVFDESTKEHIGTSLIHVICLDRSFKKPGRTLQK